MRELLSHTGGVDSPPSVWADSVADAADVLGPVVGCSGPRGQFAYSYGYPAYWTCHPVASQSKGVLL